MPVPFFERRQYAVSMHYPNKQLNCCCNVAGASLCYDIAVSCRRNPCIHDVVGRSGALTLAPGPVTDVSALVCGCCSSTITIPSCETCSVERRAVSIEAPCQTICRDFVESSWQADGCVVCKPCCIWSSTNKKASVSTACAGDAVTYTVTFTNHSPIALDMVCIADIVPTAVTVITDSIHPVPGLGETLQTGISMGGLASGESVVLTYTVIVNSGPACKIENCACARYYYTDCSGCRQYGVGSSKSCIVRKLPGDSNVAIVKLADKKSVCNPFEEITYTLVVLNTGNVALRDVVVSDTIPKGLCYKTRSTTRNEGTPADENPQNGFPIGTLNPGESYSIGFILYVCIDPFWGHPTTEFLNIARVRCRAGKVTLCAVSDPWVVILKGLYLYQCVQRHFPIPGFNRFRYCYVYHRGTYCFETDDGHIIDAKFGIAVMYIDGDGKQKRKLFESSVLFHDLSDNFDPACFIVHFTNLICGVDLCGNIAAEFEAKLCDSTLSIRIP